MKVPEVYPSPFLCAADLKNQEREVEISKTPTLERMPVDGKEKIVVHLTSAGKPVSKPLVLCKTNAVRIAAIAGSEETNNWVGVKFVIHPTVDRGKLCIRVK